MATLRRIAALLRRTNPQLKRGAAAGAIVLGVGMLVLAYFVTPLTGAAPQSHQHRRAQVRHVAAADDLPLSAPASPSPTAPAHRKTPSAPHENTNAGTSGKTTSALMTKPRHVRKPVRVTAAVISGLASNGIPTVALNAYRVAARRVDHIDPGCGIDWALLAGIGRVESDHGRFAGAVLHADGRSTPKIIGPALDGKHFDFVPAAVDGKALDGDATYAHALGPMQFIPQTWSTYGTDGNGDGVADVFNVNDAALAAARLLCAAGGDLRTASGRERAVLAYNHSDQYLAEVLALAAAYRTGTDVGSIRLVGNTTGGLGHVPTAHVPPANPGKPTALRGHRSHHHGSRSRHHAAEKHQHTRHAQAGSHSTTGAPPRTGSATPPTAPPAASSGPTPTTSSTAPPTASPTPIKSSTAPSGHAPTKSSGTGSESTQSPQPTCAAQRMRTAVPPVSSAPAGPASTSGSASTSSTASPSPSPTSTSRSTSGTASPSPSPTTCLESAHVLGTAVASPPAR